MRAHYNNRKRMEARRQNLRVASCKLSVLQCGMYKGIPATAMLSIRNAAYMAITLHFLRKIATRVIPDSNVRYMVTAIHPNQDVGGYGKLRDNVLVIVLAQAADTVSSESISPSSLWTTLLLPVNKVADYANTNSIRYIMPIWEATRLSSGKRSLTM